VPEADLVVVCVARLDPLKGHETLLEAAALASGSGVAVTLVCVGAERDGSASMGEALKRRSASLGLEERVIWAGHQQDVGPWLHAADAAGLASHEECAPLALVEAGAAGLPLIGTRVGGIPEIVRPGETGFLIRPGDAAACARAFGELARDAALRRSLGSGALAAVRRDFDATTGDARWAELIEMLLEGAR
jgi:glycosyltransferase involved in cell wall biosynthesis